MFYDYMLNNPKQSSCICTDVLISLHADLLNSQVTTRLLVHVRSTGRLHASYSQECPERVLWMQLPSQSMDIPGACGPHFPDVLQFAWHKENAASFTITHLHSYQCWVVQEF